MVLDELNAVSPPRMLRRRGGTQTEVVHCKHSIARIERHLLTRKSILKRAGGVEHHRYANTQNAPHDLRAEVPGQEYPPPPPMSAAVLG